MATSPLCTPDQVRAFLSLPAAQDDALLTDLCARATAFVGNVLSRNLLRADYVEIHGGHGGDRLPLIEGPITAVTSVQIDDVEIPPAQGSHGCGYLFDERMLYLRGYAFTRGVLNVRVAYTAGLETAPEDVVQATIEIVSAKYKRRTDLHVSGKTLNGETITFSQADVPASAKTALNSYTRVYIG